jgi:UPF0271 protein
MAMPPEAVRAAVPEQCSHLARIAQELHASVTFVKAHGALYHAANRDRAVSDALLQGARQALGTQLTVVGPARGELAAATAQAGLPYAREGFADRAMRADGTLVPREEPGALIVEPTAAAARARELAASGDVDTICVHGDTPGAVAIAHAVRAVLDAIGCR